eukprot:1182868-Prorocentrum_minimum.AAC.4
MGAQNICPERSGSQSIFEVCACTSIVFSRQVTTNPREGFREARTLISDVPLIEILTLFILASAVSTARMSSSGLNVVARQSPLDANEARGVHDGLAPATPVGYATARSRCPQRRSRARRGTCWQRAWAAAALPLLGRAPRSTSVHSPAPFIMESSLSRLAR